MLGASQTQSFSPEIANSLFAVNHGQRALGGSTLSVPITITVSYTDTEMVDIDETSLRLYWWSQQSSEWTRLETSLDIFNNVATANTEVLGLFALLADDNDIQGPLIGDPVFPSSVHSSETLSVTAIMNDSATGNHGVDSALLRFGYSVPYTQTLIAGASPGGTGDGTWVFSIPPQGQQMEGTVLRFRIEAIDGDVSPGISINDNSGLYFAVTVLAPQNGSTLYLPLLTR
jgi:hypothetical protein